MAIGFECFNFAVRNAFKGPDLESLKKCARGGHQLIFLENRDKLGEVPIKYLIAIYKFFTGNIAKHPDPGLEAEWLKEMVPLIRISFDDAKIIDSKKYVKPETNEKAAKADKPKKAPRETEPEAEEETETEPQKTDTKENEMATKKAAKKATKKTASKKAAKKAPAKKAANGSGARGRKAPYAPTDKIYPLVKENPCHPTFNGKPGVRHANMQIILKNPGITFENFIKKGGTLNDLQGLAVRKKYARVATK